MTEETVYRAKLAEQLEMYKEMKEIMQELVKTKGGSLSEEERNLLSVAYKNVVGQRRSAWRLVCSIEGKISDDWKSPIVKEMRETIEKELNDLCHEIIDLLEKHMLPPQDEFAEVDMSDAATVEKVEGAVFFYKMKGDYFRYLVEVSRGDKRDEMSEQAKAAYKWAEKVAQNLKPTHPIRLGLALNFSVYHYEIAGNPQDACELARKAFDDAIAELDSASEDTYKDSTLILQLLRDNLSLWTAENDQEEQDDK
ncbi:14-3-3 protein homolog 2-like isoform X2 [Symsagittifera roscoffensis]|uniref:14-3-3 protein homolog 2-like isoform X2 n=1 Tax=Symsagittifera roscoffensis TaxID=84072 RepID=UPI00307B7A0E